MKTMIIEDEALAAKHLRQVLEEIGNFNVIASLESISETIEWFSRNNQPEIVFMDVHLADGLAFEIFNHIDINCPIIFTTAYDEYALKAFKVNSVDYLLKPIESNDVRTALAKMKTLSESGFIKDSLSGLMDFLRKSQKFRTHFLIPTKGDKLLPLKVTEVACFFIDSSMVKAQTLDGRSIHFDYTLDDLSEILDPSAFFRANRQFIIAREAIKDIDLWFSGKLSVNLKIDTPCKIIISKAKVPEFKSWFSEPISNA